jgi:hypothetical protein
LAAACKIQWFAGNPEDRATGILTLLFKPKVMNDPEAEPPGYLPGSKLTISSDPESPGIIPPLIKKAKPCVQSADSDNPFIYLRPGIHLSTHAENRNNLLIPGGFFYSRVF